MDSRTIRGGAKREFAAPEIDQAMFLGGLLVSAVVGASSGRPVRVLTGEHRLDQFGRGGAGQTIEKIRPLKPNLYMVTGGGANTLIRVTPEGLIVVEELVVQRESRGVVGDLPSP